ncbi:unnamed protein product [Peniophora sp. CBMAI 1063]|nr:unnamed protein product [Peniophora sp. CBMAI 1063]
MSASVEVNAAGPSVASPTATSISSRPVAIYLQDACLQHRYIRSRDTSNVVERPERLRAVKVGLAAAIARLEEETQTGQPPLPDTDVKSEADDLADAIGRMNIASTFTPPRKAEEEIHVASGLPIRVVRSSATVDLLSHPAAKHIHGDIECDVYLGKLRDHTRSSRDKIAKGELEIFEGLNKGDLYLCPESLDAIQGALGTTCEAVDAVIAASRATEAVAEQARRAFVAIRPPGHHCGEDTPSGFCWVNNVAVGAAHAHLQHGVNRIIILDIDLHHGNGTQSIIWQINEEAYRLKLEREGGAPVDDKPSMQVYYGSVHDILSYPCEDGKMELVQAASVSIHGQHGQYIENIHLETYDSDDEFWDALYRGTYSRLLKKAQHFLESTDSGADDAMVFISCGFDACEHEYDSMQRHQRKVPTSFYHRFTRDACEFADKWTSGRVVSLLEGGYSDKALSSGAMAHITGMVGGSGDALAREAWWTPDYVDSLSKLTARKKRGKVSLSATDIAPEQWLSRTSALLAQMDPTALTQPRNIVPPSTRTLRARTPADTRPSTAEKAKAPASRSLKPPSSAAKAARESDNSLTESSSSDSSADETPAPPPRGEAAGQKKLPRVVLKLGPRPEA